MFFFHFSPFNSQLDLLCIAVTKLTVKSKQINIEMILLCLCPQWKRNFNNVCFASVKHRTMLLLKMVRKRAARCLKVIYIFFLLFLRMKKKSTW